MARQKKKQEDGVGQGWLMTFSDMVTLLLCFFVLLFMMSTMDAQKFMQLVSNLQGNPYIFDVMQNAHNVGQTGLEMAPEVPDGDFIDPSDSWMVLAGQMQADIGDFLDSQGDGSNLDINLRVTEAQIIISIQGEILFPTLSDELLESSYEALDFVMDMVVRNWDDVQISEIEIGGHADIRPIRGTGRSQFRSNRHLSQQRALRVLEYVEANFDFPPDKISSKGYGEYRPIPSVGPGSTEAEWQQNRRVEFVLYRNFRLDEQTGDTFVRGV
jgi:chemotaxis protein MotB